MKETLERIIKILNDSNAKWWLDYGQLLSLHRSGEPLKWIDDWDFCIVPHDEKTFKNILDKVKRIAFISFLKRGKYIKLSTLGLTFDLYFCQENFETRRMEELNFPQKLLDMKLFYFDRLEHINWSGIKFNVPRHLDQFLLVRYGANWKTPVRMKNSFSFNNHGKEFEKGITTALVAGVFDGLHKGHQNIINHAIKHFDRVKIGVHSDRAIDYKEPPTYTMLERISEIALRYPNVEIIEDCPLITDKDYLESNNCDFVVFGDEDSENISKFYPDQEVNHPIDRYPGLSSRLIRNQT
jgi:cytidyltransferase-like protein